MSHLVTALRGSMQGLRYDRKLLWMSLSSYSNYLFRVCRNPYREAIRFPVNVMITVTNVLEMCDAVCEARGWFWLRPRYLIFVLF